MLQYQCNFLKGITCFFQGCCSCTTGAVIGVYVRQTSILRISFKKEPIVLTPHGLSLYHRSVVLFNLGFACLMHCTTHLIANHCLLEMSIKFLVVVPLESSVQPVDFSGNIFFWSQKLILFIGEFIFNTLNS